MSRPSDPDGVSVTEKSAGYSGSTSGPLDDTQVHSRETPMPIEWTITEPTRAPAAPNPNIPDVRKSLRKTDDVERDRPRDLPGWLPMALALTVLLLIVGVGGLWIVRMVTPAETAPAAKPVELEDLEGVPVRKGLNDG